MLSEVIPVAKLLGSDAAAMVTGAGCEVTGGDCAKSIKGASYSFGRERKPMPLRIRNISHDAITKVAVINFADILDDMPHVTATFKLPTAGTETEVELEVVITSRAKELLSEALRLCVPL